MLYIAALVMRHWTRCLADVRTGHERPVLA